MKNKKLTEPATAFLKFVRSKMLTKVLRKGEEDSKGVYLGQADIERFFPYPKCNKKAEIQCLIDKGELIVTPIKSSNGFCYEAKPGAYDLSLLKPIIQKPDALTQKIKNHLRLVSLPVDAPSTPYFNLFLKHGNQYTDLFFNVDNFSGRVHTPVSSFHRTHRPNLLLNGEPIASFDVAQSQPTILAKILKANIGENAFSSWINSGKDVYEILQEKAGLKDRDESKNLFYLISFSKPNDQLLKYFGEADWISWINKYKSSIDRRNPKHETKPHSNMAWMLQMTEVLIMRKIWNELANINIPFLTVHDEIICCQSDAFRVRLIMDEILSKEYPVYKLNISPELNGKTEISIQPSVKVEQPNRFIPKKNSYPCKQETLNLKNEQPEPTTIKISQTIAFVDTSGKLFIKSPFSSSFLAYNTVNEYNHRLCTPTVVNADKIETANMTKVEIDSETLTIKIN